MTAHRDLKHRIRDRQARTGESYMAARSHVVRERAALLGLSGEPALAQRGRVEAAMLKVNERSARVRILGEGGQVTFRSGDVWAIVPGQLVTLVAEKSWTWKGDAYASGRIENPRIDVAKLGLVPLPLHDGQLEDLRAVYEPYEDPDPYAPLWRTFTAEPRMCYEMDPIAWGALPDADPEENPTCDAAELIEAGDRAGARELLMDALLRDLRCIDAHAHLGHLAFDRAPEEAVLHYEVGVRIGELSLPAGFEGVLPWGMVYNRPFLRCLHGYGLCLWRFGRLREAQAVFERNLSLNPNDNQGVRFCWENARNGRNWEEMGSKEAAP